MKGQVDRLFRKKQVFHRNRGDFMRAVKGWFHVYCRNTSLHGFRYITARETTIPESVFWFLTCALSLVFCTILMLRVWVSFLKNPTVTTINTAKPIWELSFPGVTICNNNKVYQPHADTIAEVLSRYGIDGNSSDQYFSSLAKLIRPGRINTDEVTAVRVLNVLDLTVDDLMYELMQPCNALLTRCVWLGQVYDCNKIFKTVKSKDGFCCAFNSHFELTKTYGYQLYAAENDTRDWNVSAKLPGVDSVQTAPGAGRDVGLAVALNVEGKTYKGSVTPYVGATVLIHDPLDYPDIGVHSATLKPGHVVAIAVSGTATKSDQDLRNLPLQKRMCLFDGETPGERKYSYQSCISECLYKRIQRFCGCLPFYYPYPRSLSQLRTQLSRDCMCLPQCTDKWYDIVTESVSMDEVAYDSEITNNLTIRNVSILYVYFRDVTYLEYHKQIIMTWDQLLASFGGLFGLCLGGSVMSLVELLYHIATEFRTRRGERINKESAMKFPPASEMFLSIPLEKSHAQRGLNQFGTKKRLFLVNTRSNIRD